MGSDFCESAFDYTCPEILSLVRAHEFDRRGSLAVVHRHLPLSS